MIASRGSGQVAIPALLVVAALALWGGRGHRRASTATARADSLATDLLAERARTLDLEVLAGEARRSLLEDLARADGQMEALARELEAARARPVARTVVVAEASGVAEAPAVALPDSVTAVFQDGPLSARVTHYPTLGIVRLPWSITVPLEQVLAVGPDRRLIAFARSRDPRVEVSIDTLHFQFPEPERRGSPIRCAATAGGAGALNGWLLARHERMNWAALGIGTLATLVACR